MNDRSWEQVWGTARAGVKPEHRRLKNNQAWLPVLGDRLNEDGNLIGPNWFGIRTPLLHSDAVDKNLGHNSQNNS